MAFALGVAKHVPPPNIREEPLAAFAHCPDPRCPGVAQQPVQAVKTITEWTYASRGGGDDPGGMGNLFLNMVENTQEHLAFADREDENCEHCGRRRELAAAPRPAYPIQVGGQNALLRLQELGVQFDGEKQERIQTGAKETPLELLQRRFVNDEIDTATFETKRTILEPAGPKPAAKRKPADG